MQPYNINRTSQPSFFSVADLMLEQNKAKKRQGEMVKILYSAIESVVFEENDMINLEGFGEEDMKRCEGLLASWSDETSGEQMKMGVFESRDIARFVGVNFLTHDQEGGYFLDMEKAKKLALMCPIICALFLKARLVVSIYAPFKSAIRDLLYEDEPDDLEMLMGKFSSENLKELNVSQRLREHLQTFLLVPEKFDHDAFFNPEQYRNQVFNLTLRSIDDYFVDMSRLGAGPSLSR